MVEQKRYAIPYNPDTKSWDPVEVKARVINTGDQKAQNLKDKIVVEDARSSKYAAIKNNVLLIDRIEKLQKIEAGDQANITVRLNDSDPGIKEVLKRNSRFNLKVTLFPDPDGKNEPPNADSPCAEGFTEVFVQQPLKWDLTFKKAFWDSSKVIDLSKQEGVDKDQLMELGNWGGKLILKPVGVFTPDDGSAKIIGDKTIEDAQQCTLDIGDGKILKGGWNEWYYQYEFEIPRAQSDGMGTTPVEMEAPCHVEMLPGYAKFFHEVIKYTKNLQKNLGGNTAAKAREYIKGYLNFIAEEKEDSLVNNREDIRTWVINIPSLLYSIKYSTIVYFRALDLFNEGYGRFIDNMLNGFVEFIFWVFDFVFKKLKSLAGRGEEVFADVAQDAVETAAKETSQELAKQKSFLEATLEALQLQVKKLDDQMDDLGRQLLNASKEKRAGILTKMNRIITENNQVLAKITQQSKEVADLNINQLIVEYATKNSKNVTKKGFMEGMEAYIKKQSGNPTPEVRRLIEQIKDFGGMRMGNIAKLETDIKRRLTSATADNKYQLEQMWVSIQQYKDYAEKSMLWDFPMSETQNQLMKAPLSERLKKVHDAGVEMEESYEKQRYKSVPRIHYEPGVMGWFWHKVDSAIESLAWFYDYIVEGLKKLAGLIGYAVDVILYYVNAIIDWIIKITDTHAYTRTWISETYRSSGQATVMSKAGGDFFKFPRKLVQFFADKCRPDNVINQAGSGGQANLNNTKQRFKSESQAQLQAENNKQKSMANRFFLEIFNEALDPMNFHRTAAGSHVRTHQIKEPFQSILSMVEEYEDAFVTAGQKGTDGIVKLSSRFGTNFTFQDLDTAIEWLSWSFSWLIRLGSLLLVFTGAGAVSIPAWWGYAEIMDRVAAGIRPVVSWVGTMPTVIGLQNDAITLSALMYDATIHGTVFLDDHKILTL